MDKPIRSTIQKTYEPMSRIVERSELELARDQVEWGSEVANILTPIDVLFVSGMTRAMGRFSGRKMQIRLSRDLWLRATPEEREETLYHELAHGVDYLRNGCKWRRGNGRKRLLHDRVFKTICRSFGQKGDRCHQVDTSGLRGGRRRSTRQSYTPRPTPVVTRAAAQTSATPSFSVGDKVVFGRSNGEQTEGLVVKINRKRVKIRQIGSRGTKKNHKDGTVWNVPFSLVRKI